MRSWLKWEIFWGFVQISWSFVGIPAKVFSHVSQILLSKQYQIILIIQFRLNTKGALEQDRRSGKKRKFKQNDLKDEIKN